MGSQLWPLHSKIDDCVTRNSFIRIFYEHTTQGEPVSTVVAKYNFVIRMSCPRIVQVKIDNVIHLTSLSLIDQCNTRYQIDGKTEAHANHNKSFPVGSLQSNLLTKTRNSMT